MDLKLITRHLDRRQSLIDLAQRRASFAFDRFSDLVRGIEIRLSDVNGPRGGQGISCLARVQLARGGEVMVETSSSSPEDGIEQSIAQHAISGQCRDMKRSAPLRMTAVAHPNVVAPCVLDAHACRRNPILRATSTTEHRRAGSLLRGWSFHDCPSAGGFETLCFYEDLASRGREQWEKKRQDAEESFHV